MAFKTDALTLSEGINHRAVGFMAFGQKKHFIHIVCVQKNKLATMIETMLSGKLPAWQCELTEVVVYSFLLSLPLTPLICVECVGDSVEFLRYLPCVYVSSFLIWYGNAWLADWLDERLPWLEQPEVRFWTSIASAIFYTISIFFLAEISFSLLLKGLTWELFWKTYDFSKLLVPLAVTAIINLFLHGRQFFIAWKQSVQEAEHLRQAHLLSQYESLKSQINPHFLFNSLNVLTSLIDHRPDQAVIFVKHLSDVYRYILDNRDREVVPLEAELNAVLSYRFLLKTRFQDNILFEIDPRLEAVETSHYVLPLSIQMLVENAVKHNIISRARPLTVSIFKEGDSVVVRNNLQVKHQSQPTSGIGLANITARYQYLTAVPVRQRCDEVYFEVSLPLLRLANVPLRHRTSQASEQKVPLRI